MENPKQLDTPVREKDENEFLPAHLELIETPVSRRSRLVAYFIMGFLVIAFILSVLGGGNCCHCKWEINTQWA